MGKINTQDYSKSRPKLSPDDFEGGDGAALVIATTEDFTVNDAKGKRKVMTITFEETGDKVFIPNLTSLKVIVEAYGDDSDGWIGQALPLLRNEGVYNDIEYKNLQVPPLDQWPHIIKGSGLKVTHKVAAPAKVAPAPARKVRR